MELDRDKLHDLRKASNILLGFETDEKKFRNILPDENIEESLRIYISPEHHKINKRLRSLKKGSEITEEFKNLIDNIDEGMIKVRNFRIQKPFIVWRGEDIDEDDMSGYYQKLMNFHHHKFINNQAYLSTSYSKESAQRFTNCCLFKIYVDPKENLDYILFDITDEKEILFQHTTYFEYISHQFEEEDNQKYILFEVNLKKGSIVEEYTVSKKIIVKTDKDLYKEILGRIPNIIDKDSVESIKDFFLEPTLEKVQESIFEDFLNDMKNSYPKNIADIQKYIEELKSYVYEYVAKLY